MSLALPTGSVCFLDTNILYYHFVGNYAESPACSQLVERLVLGDLDAFCSFPVLADLVHKVMMAEAHAKMPTGKTGLSAQLRQAKSTVQQLTAFAQIPGQLKSIPLVVAPVGLEHLAAASAISRSEGLLTNDAIIVALMREHGIIHLATNDDDFDAVAGITVWKPR